VVLAAIALPAGWCVGQPCDDALGAPVRRNCGVASLEAMARLLGRPISDEQGLELAEALPDESVSMLQMRGAAGIVGLNLAGVQASLDALCRDVPGPKIIHLDNPSHFLVLVRADAAWAQVVDGARLGLVPRPEVEKRYAGQALIAQLPDLDEAAKAQPDAFCYAFGIAGVGQKVEHAFRISNTGKAPLSLRTQDGGG
jgi:ABC-type bacteriocin/lantibiotic exporter with double-glycine peptidase domain